MLVYDLKVHLGTTFTLFTKAAGFHWNVEGSNFPQYHEFLGKLYGEVYGSIDRTAEYIRTLDAYAPGGLKALQSLSVLQDEPLVLMPTEMMTQLYSDIEQVIEQLEACFDSAAEENKQGIANYIAERIDAYEKHLWMIRSILKANQWIG